MIFFGFLSAFAFNYKIHLDQKTTTPTSPQSRPVVNDRTKQWWSATQVYISTCKLFRTSTAEYNTIYDNILIYYDRDDNSIETSPTKCRPSLSTACTLPLHRLCMCIHIVDRQHGQQEPAAAAVSPRKLSRNLQIDRILIIYYVRSILSVALPSRADSVRPQVSGSPATRRWSVVDDDVVVDPACRGMAQQQHIIWTTDTYVLSNPLQFFFSVVAVVQVLCCVVVADRWTPMGFHHDRRYSKWQYIFLKLQYQSIWDRFQVHLLSLWFREVEYMTSIYDLVIFKFWVSWWSLP